jgi:hypothetical protein
MFPWELILFHGRAVYLCSTCICHLYRGHNFIFHFCNHDSCFRGIPRRCYMTSAWREIGVWRILEKRKRSHAREWEEKENPNYTIANRLHPTKAAGVTTGGPKLRWPCWSNQGVSKSGSLVLLRHGRSEEDDILKEKRWVGRFCHSVWGTMFP